LRLLNNIATTQIRNINVKLHPVLPFVKNILALPNRARPNPILPCLTAPGLALPSRALTIHATTYSPATWLLAKPSQGTPRLPLPHQ